MPMHKEALYHLMTWFSPSYPIGSFNYSHGIEYAVQCRLVNDAKSLQEWITGIIQLGTGRIDASLFRAAYELFLLPKPFASDRLNDLISLSNALKASPEFWAESSKQGAAALKTLLATYASECLGFLKVHLKEMNKQPTVAIVFGTICAEYQIPLEEALIAYLHAFAANLVSAGIKLIPLGHTDGQRITAALKNTIQKTIACVIKSSIAVIGGATPMIDWTSVQHENQYTKLFQS